MISYLSGLYENRMAEKANFNYEKFWKIYRVTPVPGDGHCLLHAIVKSCASQRPDKYEIHEEKLLHLLRRETLENSHRYMQFLLNRGSLKTGLENYVRHKVYNSEFGDIVPLVLSNALGLNIEIVYRNGERFNSLRVVCDRSQKTDDVLYIYKDRDHYNALTRNHIPVSDDTNVEHSPKTSEHLEPNDAGQILGSVIKGKPNCVNICSWNINGLTDDKLCILEEYLTKFDIVLLSETWTCEGENYTIPGFKYYNFPRQYIHPNAKRGSGGIGVLIRDIHVNKVDISGHKEDIIVWVRLRKECFGFLRDVMLGCVYIAPEHSTHTREDAFNMLESEIACISKDQDIMICGDYNARTGLLPDFSAHCLSGNDDSLPVKVPSDDLIGEQITRCLIDRGMLLRYSEDNKSVNNYGKKLLDMCKTTGLLIVNGRIGLDKGLGKYTRSDTTGNSVVDYVICSPNLFVKINDFYIQEKLPESDHLPLCMSLVTDEPGDNASRNTDNSWRPCYRYKWDFHGLENMKRNLIDNISRPYLKDLYDRLADLSCTSVVAEAHDEYIMQACNRACTLRRTRPPGKKRPLPWYDEECKTKRAQAIRAGHHVVTDSERQHLIQRCQDYRACKQRKKRTFQRECVKRIEYAYYYDKSNLWPVLDDISRDSRSEIPLSGDVFLSSFHVPSDSP